MHLEENYDYKEETKKWLRPKQHAEIRIGEKFQAVIPEFSAGGPKKEDKTKEIKEEEKAETKTMTQKSMNCAGIWLGTEAETPISKAEKEEKVDMKKPKVDE